MCHYKTRKTRTRRKKPKYLSLNLKLNKPQKKPKMTATQKKQNQNHQQEQLNLFPLHPENMHEADNNIDVTSFLFDTATDSTTTLNGLLTSATSKSEETENNPVSPPPPPSLTYHDHGSIIDGLVRTAMRCKERDASEEKWVSYSEVVDEKKKIKEEEGSSCVIDDDGGDDDDEGACVKKLKVKQGIMIMKKSLDLKLDYEEILNAWSDKGSLYIDGESPQIVPDLLHDFSNVPMDGLSNVGNLWTVPEMTSNVGEVEGWKREHREASVLRYKEKRRNRLFSKRIRYEVRRLNAEKRPRMKGRFVKRSSEEV